MTALTFSDRIRETTTSSGNSNVVLNGPVSHYRAFSNVPTGSTVCYGLVSRIANEWEVGYGVYNSSDASIARTTILSSTNSNAKVDFSTGTKDIYLTHPTQFVATYATQGLTEGYLPHYTSGNLCNTNLQYISGILYISSINSTNLSNFQIPYYSGNLVNSPLIINGGNVGIGITPTSRFHIVDTSTATSSTQRSSNIAATAQPGSSSSANYYSIQASMDTAGNNNFTGILRGGNFTSSVNGGGTVNEIVGFNCIGQVSTAATNTTTTLAGFNALVANLSAGATVSNMYGVRIQAVQGTGIVTSSYGCYIGNVSVKNTTTAYGLYSEGTTDRSYIGGKLGVGSGLTNPTAYLHCAPATTSFASLRIGSGVAPSSPNDGDFWFEAGGLKFRIGGVTRTVTLT